MLDSLYIKNYRNLKEFKIDSVDQVNLVTGKNNTGKSTILESIAVFASRGDFSQIYNLLNNRGEDFSRSSSAEESKDILEMATRSLSAIFTDRLIDFAEEGAIVIGNVLSDTPLSGNNMTLRFVKYHEDIQKGEQGEIIRRRMILAKDENEVDVKIGFEVRRGREGTIVPLDRARVPYRPDFGGLGGNEKFQLIRTGSIDREINGRLFDNIALSEKEKYVIEALKIIEPRTERIAFIEEKSRERTAVIKLSNIAEVLPLRSMGDGINRILTIILALVNSDNGYLLLDEIENGLHYSVQEQLWKIIFQLSRLLNVQVFATTHSEDCIAGFQKALNDADNEVRGKLIRLDNINGIIKPVEYSPVELKIANEQDIETR